MVAKSNQISFISLSHFTWQHEAKYLVMVNFDLRWIKGQTSLLRSTRKVNKIVTVISRLILTARAIDVTKFSINM